MPSSHTPKEAGRARNASFICTPKLASTCPGINFLTALSDGEEGSCPGDEVFQPEHPSIVLSPPIVLEAALWPLMWGQEGPPPPDLPSAGKGSRPGTRGEAAPLPFRKGALENLPLDPDEEGQEQGWLSLQGCCGGGRQERGWGS